VAELLERVSILTIRVESLEREVTALKSSNSTHDVSGRTTGVTDESVMPAPIVTKSVNMAMYTGESSKTTTYSSEKEGS